MRKTILGLACLLSSALSIAQTTCADNDTTTFKGHFANKEYNIYICLDAYAKNILVPDQEIFGALSGYLGDNQDSRKWLFTGSSIRRPGELTLSVINDYGSEDLVATLTRQNDTTFVLRQGEGSVLKIARNRKWQKLPKSLTFVKSAGNGK